MKGPVSMYRVFNVLSGSLVVTLVLLGGTAIAGPKLVCDEPSYNFGEREGGESVEHTFVIKNVGDAPADMKKLRPSCGCAVLSAPQDKLAPGAESPITLRVTLGTHVGPFHKSLAIASGDGSQDGLTLTLEGAVTSTLCVLPEQLELGSVDAGKQVTRSVIVAFAQEEPVKITRTMSDVDTMVSEVKTLKEGGLYRVTVRVKAPNTSPRIEARVLLYTDSKKYPMVVIPVTGSVLVDLAATPNEIILAGEPDLAVERYVVIRSPKGKPFEIKEVQCPVASVKAEVTPVGNAAYRLEISGLRASPDLDGKAIVVKTSLASVPTIQIPLRVRRPATGQPESHAQALPAPEPVVGDAFRLPERRVDRGEVRMGPPIGHTFRLLNLTNQTRHIVNVTAGCTCAKVVRFPTDVAPHAWAEVVASLDTTEGEGFRQASVLIETDDTKVPTFVPLVSFRVLPAVETTLKHVACVSRGTSGFLPQSLDVVGLYPDEKIAIGKIEASDPMVSVTKETVEEHRRFRLTVTVNKDMPAGVTLAYLTIHIEGSAQKQLWLPLTIANVIKMKAEPSALALFLDKDAPQTAEFTVKTLDKSPLEVKKVELNGVVLRATSQPAADNAVLVRLEGIKATPDMNLKHVRVMTNQGELRLPVSVRARPSSGGDKVTERQGDKVLD